MRREVVVFSAVFLVVGVGLGIWVLPGDWSLLARIGAGVALAGAATISLFANRIIGGDDFD
ncbi:MAG: hypothetical protein R3F59_23925 [Myxococcota bacterium]